MVSVLLTLGLLDMFAHFSVILKALSGAMVCGNLPKFGWVLTSKVRPRAVILNVTLGRCFGRKELRLCLSPSLEMEQIVSLEMSVFIYNSTVSLSRR